jgi:UrcA family protein
VSKQTLLVTNTRQEITMSRFAPSACPRPRAFAILAAFGALTAVVSLASPAVASAAQPAADVLQTTVYYSFSDFSTSQGTHALYRRIESAARTVCPGYDSQDLAAVADSRECQRQAVAHAIGQIGNARLAAVHAHAVARRG